MQTTPSDERPPLEERLDVMKREIDALQIQAMKSDRPWYKQVPVVAPLLVSLLALLFSFATTYVAEHRVAREERHDARVELRGLIQRLVGLSKENVKLHREYADDSQALAALSSATNTENIVLGQQAADLISELGDDVEASEYYAVAYALSEAGLTAASENLIIKGIATADDMRGESALLCQHAQLLFAIGDLDGGGRRWRQAMEIFEKYPERNRYVVASSHAYTQVNWAQAELARRQCAEARRHIRSAQTFGARAPSPSVTLQIRAVGGTIAKQCGPTLG